MKESKPKELIRDFWNGRSKDATNRWTNPDLLSWELEFLRSKWNGTGQILDLGCGSGDLSRNLAGNNHNLVAVDFEEGFSRFFSEKNFVFIQSEVDKFYSEERFSLILLMGVVLYLNEDEERSTYLNAREMLVNGGLFFVKNQVSLTTSKIFDGFSEKLGTLYWGRYPNLEDQVEILNTIFDEVVLYPYPNEHNSHQDTIHMGFLCRKKS